MLRDSIAAYTELANGAVNFQWIERPELLLARDAKQLATVREKAATIAAQGVRVELLEVADMRTEMPQLSEKLAGGAVLYGAYSLDANSSLHAVVDAGRAEGITVKTGVRVAQLEIQAGRLRGLLTDEGRVAVDAAVLATGPWLSDLLPTAPVKAGRGWLLRSEVAGISVPWMIEEASWPDQIVLGEAGTAQALEDLAGGGHEAPVGETFFLSPQINGQMLVGASLSTSLRDAVEGIDVPARIARRALELAPGLARELRITRAWSGLRPMTPDGLPLVGATDIEGLWLHGGHASLGVQAAPASAKWLAEHIVSGESNPFLERLAPDRFANRDT